MRASRGGSPAARLPHFTHDSDSARRARCSVRYHLAGNANAHDEGTRRRQRAAGCHHLREDATEMVGGQQHAVAGVQRVTQFFRSDALAGLDAIIFPQMPREPKIDQHAPEAAVAGRDETIGLVDDELLHGATVLMLPQCSRRDACGG